MGRGVQAWVDPGDGAGHTLTLQAGTADGYALMNSYCVLESTTLIPPDWSVRQVTTSQ